MFQNFIWRVCTCAQQNLKQLFRNIGFTKIWRGFFLKRFPFLLRFGTGEPVSKFILYSSLSNLKSKINNGTTVLRLQLAARWIATHWKISLLSKTFFCSLTGSWRRKIMSNFMISIPYTCDNPNYRLTFRITVTFHILYGVGLLVRTSYSKHVA